MNQSSDFCRCRHPRCPNRAQTETCRHKRPKRWAASDVVKCDAGSVWETNHPVRACRHRSGHQSSKYNLACPRGASVPFDPMRIHRSRSASLQARVHIPLVYASERATFHLALAPPCPCSEEDGETCLAMLGSPSQFPFPFRHRISPLPLPAGPVVQLGDARPFRR